MTTFKPWSGLPEYRRAEVLAEAVQVIRDLPTLGQRVLYAAVSSSFWRRCARNALAAGQVESHARWTFYADYLASVGERLIEQSIGLDDLAAFDAATFADLR